MLRSSYQSWSVRILRREGVVPLDDGGVMGDVAAKARLSFKAGVKSA
jgi:hypothetical protein